MTTVYVPGEGDVEFPDSMNDEQIAAAIQKTKPRKNTALEDLKDPRAWARAGGLMGRAALEGVSGLPYMAADAGVALRNLVTGSNYEVPSKEKERLFNQYLPEPKGLVEKGGSLAVSALVGSRLPAPQAAQQAPKGFVPTSPTATRDAVLASSQKAGYVVPPTTSNPSTANKLIESIGGKAATAQDASLKNQAVTNELAKQALGLTGEQPVTQAALSGIRSQAGSVYEKLRGVGEIATDPSYADDLEKIVASSRGAAKSFPGLGKSEIDDVVATLKQEKFDSGDAIDAMSILREKADAAFASGDKALGKSYKAASNAIENMLERAVKKAGDSGLLAQFREARQTIAKTYTVEKALNESAGNVVAGKLAQQLAKGKPLTGDLKTIAQFGQAFPKASQQILDSGAVRNTDLIIGGGTAALAKQPGYLLYPLVRAAVRKGLLSPFGQRLTTPSGAMQVPPGLIYGGVPVAEDLANQ